MITVAKVTEWMPMLSSILQTYIEALPNLEWSWPINLGSGLGNKMRIVTLSIFCIYQIPFDGGIQHSL